MKHVLAALFCSAALAIAADTAAPHHATLTPADLRWQAGPVSLPPGGQMAVLSGDPTAAGPFVIRFKTTGDYKIMPHSHPTDEDITVISGTLYMGTGDKFDTAQARALPPGGFMHLPAGMRHFAYSTGDTVIQINSFGPFGITYVNPADDPSRSVKH